MHVSHVFMLCAEVLFDFLFALKMPKASNPEEKLPLPKAVNSNSGHYQSFYVHSV